MARETSKSSKNVETVGEPVETTQEKQEFPKEQKTPQEAFYLANELAANAGTIFNTRAECVFAALKAAGKTGCTVSEAKDIVEKFLKREVK